MRRRLVFVIISVLVGAAFLAASRAPLASLLGQLAVPGMPAHELRAAKTDSSTPTNPADSRSFAGTPGSLAEEHRSHNTVEKDVYYCPMHPHYTSDKPGDCPICGMKLVKKEKTSGVETGDASKTPKIEGYTTVGITAEKQQLIGVRVTRVEKQPISDAIRAVARVAYDPELYQMEQEYFEAKTIDESGTGSNLVHSTHEHLKLMGIREGTLAEREKQEADISLILPQKNRAWIYADIFQEDLKWVRPGLRVTVTLKNESDVLTGTIQSVEPRIMPETRTAKARILINPRGAFLTPETFGQAEIIVNHGNRLAVPMEAIVETGERKIVFVKRGEGYFEPREVALGVRGKDFVEIRRGVTAGEEIVVSGNFLIDSESKMKSALESFGGGHKH